MAINKHYTVKVKRKRQQKTDYRARLKLLASRKPRFVVRKALNNILVQFVDFHDNGDKVLVSANTRELIKFGWKGHRGNIPAAYLVGFLAGLKAKKKGIKQAVFDIGMQGAVKSSANFSVVKGAIDSGVEIPCSEEVLPDETAFSGKKIEDYANILLKEDKKVYERQFSSYLKNGVKPEQLTKHFEEVKKKISAKWQ